MSPPSSSVVYRVRVSVDPLAGRAERVELPLPDAPSIMGVNEWVASYYGISRDALRTTAEADIETVDGVTRVRRIRPVCDVRTTPGPPRERFEQAGTQHVDRCPAGSSVLAAPEIDPELRFVDA